MELQLQHENSWLISFRIDYGFPLKSYDFRISFRIDHAVQGTLKSLLQNNSLKASVIWHLAFFIVQLSHPYVTIGKTIALTRQTFAGKVMSLLFNTVSRFVIAFRPSSKYLLILWHSDFGTQGNKICHCFHIFPIYLP